MAPVILSMDVHCDSCAKKIRKAVMKVPGAESVSASFETGLVVVEGTADAETLRARLQAKTKKAVNVVSDGAEDSGEAAGGGGGGGGSASPPPSHHWSPPRAPEPADDPAPIVLEMELHCRACAEKIERRAMEIPGVDAVSTDVAERRVKVTGTADASAVATSLEVRMRMPVRVVSDPRSSDALGYEHEWRKAAAARAAAERMQEMYGETAHVEPTGAGTETDASSLSSLSSAAPPPFRRRRRRSSQRAPSPPPPVQPGGSSLAPSSPPASSYGDAPPPPAAYYYYPAPGEVYGGQYWAPPAPPTGGFYMHQGGEMYGEQWPAYPYPPPGSEPEGYYSYGCQQGENPGGCSIQ